MRVLHHFQPPTSPDEINAAALQYVRKESGIRGPGKSDVEAYQVDGARHAYREGRDLITRAVAA